MLQAIAFILFAYFRMSVCQWYTDFYMLTIQSSFIHETYSWMLETSQHLRSAIDEHNFALKVWL